MAEHIIFANAEESPFASASWGKILLANRLMQIGQAKDIQTSQIDHCAAPGNWMTCRDCQVIFISKSEKGQMTQNTWQIERPKNFELVSGTAGSFTTAVAVINFFVESATRCALKSIPRRRKARG